MLTSNGISFALNLSNNSLNMAFYRHFVYVASISILFLACAGNKNKQTGQNSRYDLLNPFVIKLPEALAEISGIAYYAKDTAVFAIEDENGILYKIFLTTNEIKKWKFDKRRDFEDLVLKDSIFYVLISNGDIEWLQFGNGDTILTNKVDFPDEGKNEFESLYYDDSLKQLTLICKKCADDSKKSVSAWSYNISAQAFKPSALMIDMEPVIEKMGQKKMKLRPSATAINPVTNELYILCTINHLLVVTDRVGKFKELYVLDPAIYKQAEGIAFTPAGDMIISNEHHETGLANILILKNQKKGL